jgi:hypothetical protein
MQTNYSGESLPLNENSTDHEKSLNRRVEISWETTAVVALVETDEIKGNVQDLYAVIELEKQSHCINPNRDTMLRLEKGTIILIPANAFKTDGKNCVTFKAKEVFSLGEMLIENVSTMSNGLMLETGGMVFTEAEDSKGNSVKLNPGKELTIMIPTETIDPNMQLFYGERDPHTNHLNWGEADFGLESLYGFHFGQCWDGGTPLPKCAYCPYVFCRVIGRIDESIAGMRDSLVKQDNKKFRACQRDWRKSKKRKRRGAIDWDYYLYGSCQTMMESFGVKDYNGLMDTLSKIRDAQLKTEYDKYGVDNYQAYADTVQKINAKRIADDMIRLGVDTRAAYYDTLQKIDVLRKKQAFESAIDDLDTETILKDLNYYVAEVGQMGWLNVDKYYNLGDREKCTLVTELVEKPYVDCKLIFRDANSILDPKVIGGKYIFDPLPKKSPVTLFALKFVGGKAFVHFQDIETCQELANINYRQVSTAELKEILLKMDF